MPAEDAIISIKPWYANAILNGTKTVELRRRIPSIPIGTRLWIYSTLPIGAVIGTAIVEKIVKDHPENLWNSYQDQVGVSYSDFQEYFLGTNQAVALILTAVQCGTPIDIGQLRLVRKGFHPPQVLSRISNYEAQTFGELLQMA